MIADLRPYAEYVDSGLPWLGFVPQHWEVRALRQVGGWMKGKQPKRLYERSEATQAFEPYLSMEYVRQQGGKPKTFCAAEKGLVQANQGDVLLLWDGANAGEFLKAKSGVVASTSALFISKVHNSRYLYYVLKQCESQLRAFSVGMGIPHVDGAVLKQMRITIPPTDEQAAIVRFLDWANSRLERTIRAKRKAITLLNEQKQTIIHRAVTRGLDPFVALKPSGIPWLGDIPQHWEVLRAKHLFACVDVRSQHGSEELLTVSSSDGIVPRSSRTVTMFKAASYVGHKLCWPGDLVINSLWAWAKGLGVSPHHGIVSTAYGVYRPVRKHMKLANYWHALLRSPAYDWELQVRSKGIWKSRLQLTDESFLSMSILVPPQDEASTILSFIDESTSGLTQATSRLQREIHFLKEYQTRLVADVVTGKLDVREAAARLSDEVPLETLKDTAELSEDFDSADEEAAV